MSSRAQIKSDAANGAGKGMANGHSVSTATYGSANANGMAHMANGHSASTATSGSANGMANGHSASTATSGTEYHWLKLLTIGASGALFGYAAKITNGEIAMYRRS